MFDHVPLARSWRIVASRNRQPRLVGQLLDVQLPRLVRGANCGFHILSQLASNPLSRSLRRVNALPGAETALTFQAMPPLCLLEGRTDRAHGERRAWPRPFGRTKLPRPCQPPVGLSCPLVWRARSSVRIEHRTPDSGVVGSNPSGCAFEFHAPLSFLSRESLSVHTHSLLFSQNGPMRMYSQRSVLQPIRFPRALRKLRPAESVVRFPLLETSRCVEMMGRVIVSAVGMDILFRSSVASCCTTCS